jgi:hypothetical protein
MTTCPSPADGASLVVNAVEDAHRALVANPSTPLPPPCVLVAFARINAPTPDSVNAHAIDLAAELTRRGGTQRELHESEVLLYSHAHRFADVSKSYDALVAVEPQPPIDVARLAIAAAHQRGDTATLIRLLTKNAPRADAPPILRSELNVLQQVGALRTAINEARGLVRQNPKYVAGYPSLVGNFGTLGAADSVVSYIRRALAQGATRASLTAGVDPFVNTTLRHAALYGSSYGWESQIATAQRVDSALTTPSTKFLIASLIVQSAEAQIGEVGAQVTGTSFGPTVLGAATSAPSMRAAGCRRVAPLLASLTLAERKLREGGDRYSGGGASQVGTALGAETARLTDLQAVCSK